MGSLDRIAYESTLRSLDKQERVLDELRARTGLVLAASSLAVSFLGRAAFESGPPWLLAPAVAGFAVSIGAGISGDAPEVVPHVCGRTRARDRVPPRRSRG